MTMIRDGNGNVIDSTNPLSVSIAGANSAGGALGVDIQSSQVIQPVDVQARYAQTIQTHNAVSVAASGSSNGAWIDSNGFDYIGVTFNNDAGTSSYLKFEWSNDGTNVHGEETGILNNTNMRKSYDIRTRARYFRLVLVNGDTAAAHIMSAWVYLKA